MLALDFDADNLGHDGRPISALTPGDRLPGGARAWERLGIGHRCETWLAWSARLCAPVVVKFPRPDQIGEPRARRALTREVAALRDNLHPALPRLYRDGTDDAFAFLELEYVDGNALDQDIEQHGRFSPVELALLVAQLLAGLRAIHGRGIVHVDVKPDNVMIREGHPVLVDFGSARAIGSPQPAGTMIGSPGYAAPELEAGAPLSPAMDLYGIGTILYEALTGAAAFEPDVPAADRPEPEPLDPSATADLALRLLDPDPAARGDLEDALGELARISADGGAAFRPDWAR